MESPLIQGLGPFLGLFLVRIPGLRKVTFYSVGGIAKTRSTIAILEWNDWPRVLNREIPVVSQFPVTRRRGSDYQVLGPIRGKRFSLNVISKH